MGGRCGGVDANKWVGGCGWETQEAFYLHPEVEMSPLTQNEVSGREAEGPTCPSGKWRKPLWTQAENNPSLHRT